MNTRESSVLHPGMNPSSLQASSLAMVPGHPECTDIAVSGPVSTPALLRDPHRLSRSVPGEVPAVNWYQMSGLVSEEPQSAEPSLLAHSRLPISVLPLRIGVAEAQLLLAGAALEMKLRFKRNAPLANRNAASPKCVMRMNTR